jgi:hypothetical protein
MTDPTVPPERRRNYAEIIAELTELRESNERLSGSVTRLASGIEAVNDLRIDQQHIKAQIHEQGELMLHARGEHADEIVEQEKARRRAVKRLAMALAFVVVLVIAGVGEVVHLNAENAVKTQQARVSCERRNASTRIIIRFVQSVPGVNQDSQADTVHLLTTGLLPCAKTYPGTHYP